MEQVDAGVVEGPALAALDGQRFAESPGCFAVVLRRQGGAGAQDHAQAR
ncbi:hypothetical protein ACFXPY_33515 [Streptomyces sp. NPDC059153]